MVNLSLKINGFLIQYTKNKQLTFRLKSAQIIGNLRLDSKMELLIKKTCSTFTYVVKRLLIYWELEFLLNTARTLVYLSQEGYRPLYQWNSLLSWWNVLLSWLMEHIIVSIESRQRIVWQRRIGREELSTTARSTNRSASRLFNPRANQMCGRCLPTNEREAHCLMGW